MVNFHRAIAAAALLAAMFSVARAEIADDIAGGVPASVTEVTTGGAWSKEGENGAFRAIVVTGAENAAPVHVYVQLLAFGKDGAASKVVKTVHIKEVVERKLQNAFVNFDSENENKATLIITSYDPEKDADKSIYAEVGADGVYKVIEGPKDETASKKQ